MCRKAPGTSRLFPWLGTRSFRTLRKFLQRCGGEFRISNLEFEGCYYMTFRMERGNDYELISALDRIASTQGIDCEALVQTGAVLRATCRATSSRWRALGLRYG